MEPFPWPQTWALLLRSLVGTITESRYESLPVGPLVVGIDLLVKVITSCKRLRRLRTRAFPETPFRPSSPGFLLNRRHTRTTKKLCVLTPEPKAIATILHIFG